jgi:hypothetical protein
MTVSPCSSRRACNLSSRGFNISEIVFIASAVMSLIHHRLFFHANATAVIHAISRHIGHVKTQIAVDILGKANASQETTAINDEMAATVIKIFAVNFGFSLIQSATF